MTPCQERAEASARKKRTSNGKWNRKHPKKVAVEKLATKLTDLRAELEAVGLEVHAMRATADGLNDELIKLTAEKAALKTKLTTRTTARSHTLAYKTEEAGRYREKLRALALEGGIIEVLRHENG
jgi:regulator of replication initiation timing